jgi:hypothetical protein
LTPSWRPWYSTAAAGGAAVIELPASSHLVYVHKQALLHFRR